MNIKAEHSAFYGFKIYFLQLLEVSDFLKKLLHRYVLFTAGLKVLFKLVHTKQVPPKLSDY